MCIVSAAIVSPHPTQENSPHEALLTQMLSRAAAQRKSEPPAEHFSFYLFFILLLCTLLCSLL